MSKVYFSKELNEKYLRVLEENIKQKFKGCKKVAVKLHFGEEGNKTAFNPEDIKPFTAILKKNGFDYFLYDSATAYEGIRDNPKTYKEYAVKKGFGTLGPIVTDDSLILVKGKYLSYEVCKPLADADAVLVISHFKGHGCCGFGGAVKNLGMGALTKKSKQEIHEGGKPEILDNCNACKACEKACNFGFLSIVNNEHVFLDCYGCSNCIILCPNKAMKPKVALFDSLLADGANTAHSQFKKDYYINVAKSITKLCDCETDSKETIAEDVGYFAGEDPVAVDKAAYDSIVKQEGIDVFLKFNQKSGLEQINEAEKLKLGRSKYQLINV